MPDQQDWPQREELSEGTRDERRAVELQARIDAGTAANEELQRTNAKLQEQIRHLTATAKNQRVNRLYFDLRRAVNTWFVSDTDFEPFFERDVEISPDGFHFAARLMPILGFPMPRLGVEVTVKIVEDEESVEETP